MFDFQGNLSEILISLHLALLRRAGICAIDIFIPKTFFSVSLPHFSAFLLHNGPKLFLSDKMNSKETDTPYSEIIFDTPNDDASQAVEEPKTILQQEAEVNVDYIPTDLDEFDVEHMRGNEGKLFNYLLILFWKRHTIQIMEKKKTRMKTTMQVFFNIFHLSKNIFRNDSWFG